MMQEIMEAMDRLQAIPKAMADAYRGAYQKARDNRLPLEQYHSVDAAWNVVPVERARADRAKMLGVLRTFYQEHRGTPEGVDAFVTLFGAYCNQYILWNLHQTLPEATFGVEALWDEIEDEALRATLLQVRQGISLGVRDGNSVFRALARDGGCSLAYLYLFLWDMICWRAPQEGEPQEHREEAVLEDLAHLPEDFRAYILGDALPERCKGLPMHPLPLLALRDQQQYQASKAGRFLASTFQRLDELRAKEQAGTSGAALEQEREACWKRIRRYAGWFNNRLKYVKHEPAVTYFFEARDRDSDHRLRRLRFLQLTCHVNWSSLAMASALIKAMLAREAERKAKEKIQQEKDEIVIDFTHTYKNMKATTLYDIAQALLQNDDANARQMGRSILLEYARKESMTKEVYMMRLKYEQDTMLLQKVLRDACVPLVEDDTADTIRTLLHQSLLMCLTSAFYDASTKDARRMKRRIGKVLAAPAADVVMDYEQHVIFQEHGDCLAWLQAKGFAWDLTVEAAWDGLGFLRDEYAAVFLRNALTELCTNIFKYGELQKPVHLVFGATADALTITLTNALPDGKRNTSDSRIGLKSLGRLLGVLWGDHEEHIRSSYEDDTFTISVAMKRCVFTAEEESK